MISSIGYFENFHIFINIFLHIYDDNKVTK